MVSTLCVVYRPIGCNDEAATDEEQGEKILYFYPEDTTLSKQLSRITMLEGLIEFSARFSKEPIETVVMEKQTWAFLQPEPDLWIIAATTNNSPSTVNGDSSETESQDCHRPNGVGFIDALMKMYRLYTLFRGNIASPFCGKGMICIRRVQEERKRIRKLCIKLSQDELDLKSSRNAEAGEEQGLGIRSDATVEDLQKVVDETRALIARAKDEVERLLSGASAVDGTPSEEYTPRVIRSNLSHFIGWYLSTKELTCASAIHSAAGVHFCPVGHPAFQSLLRVRQAAEDVSRGVLNGLMLLYDGGIAWSDFDEETTFALNEFLRLQEHESLRDSVIRYLEKLEHKSTEAADQAIDGGAGSIAARLKRVSISGGVGMTSPGSAASASPGANSAEERGMTAASEGDWARSVKARKGFITTSPPWSAVDLEDDQIQLSSGSNMSHGSRNGADSISPSSRPQAWGFASPKSIAENSSSARSRTLSSEAQFSDYSSSETRNIWTPRVFACDPRQPFSVGMNDGAKEKRGLKLGSSGADVERDMGLRSGGCRCIGRVLIYRQGAFVLALLLPDWSSDQGGPLFAVDHISKVLKLQIVPSSEEPITDNNPENDPSWSRLVGEGSLLNLCASLQRGLVPELDQLEKIIGLEESENQDTSDRTPAAISRASVDSQRHSSSSSSRQAAKKKTAIPDTVRLLYFNACNRALKSGSLFRRTVDPVLLWPYPINQLSADAPRYTMLCAALDNVRPRFPLSCALLSESTEPAVLRALNDIRETLSTRAREGGCVTEACLRVSTQQRGGVWCVGRRFGGRYVLLVIEKCSTLNDMTEVLSTVTDEVLWQVVL